MENHTSLAGRQWIINQDDSSIFPNCKKISGIINNICQRCGSYCNTKIAGETLYCRACIGLGRVSENDYLVRDLGNKSYSKQNDLLTWSGNLTARQAKVSQEICYAFKKRQDHLVHAVTGAGKTEMLFDCLKLCLEAGLRACIATPRIDVVNELYPRISSAFSKIKIGKYHGREYKDYEAEQLIICTTHQLLKFYHAFDLLIIDEVDSFPYTPSPMLHFGANNAVKTNGMKLYLTATPPDDLLEKIKHKKITVSLLNRRFHGGLLPVPKEKLFLKPFLKKKQLNKHLLKQIILVIKAGHPLLLFVPRINEIPVYLEALKACHQLKEMVIKGVHAADEARIDKVQEFRDKKIDILITTTILERGVTFKHVWVIIVAADDAIYTRASLIQIAGRVGRSSDDQDGLVLFCYHKYTLPIRQAISEIKRMNR
ncbi:helicase-related protein [Lactobacillus mulieris]|uniref:helicase-related protein n=1 Tax=Lactobacillus mulieris TaxID=2508708 RepID=UPI001432DCA1|nr:helicase-related protein [Lactobacillus mulieris]MCW8104117.1 helicase-related protein [Lactobacillus mulieris]MDK6802825.1 helicase-related protein [Lactobacillus mulieris]MDK8381941.1 helicase-related protein [Lactobacillus mulieris]MDT9620150.1 helicase-related protein [Lactobacillus mulieris]NKC41139.1 DEAD/DEAH box helicase family protein [Lactobacillus mulieris]